MFTDKHKISSAIRSIERIEFYTLDLDFETFANAQIVIDATLIHFVNLGERLSSISEGLKDKFKGLPIRNVKEMRNAISHSYDTIKGDIIWSTIRNDIPKLKKELQDIFDFLNAN